MSSKTFTADREKLLSLTLARRGIQGSRRVAITRREASGPCELSFAQQRLWFLEQLEPDTATYNIPFAVKVEGELDLRALEDSVNEIISRHEILRTTFEVRNDHPMQVIASQLKIGLPVTDLSELNAGEQERTVLDLAHKGARRSFDLSRGPLLRMEILRIGPQDHVLLFTMHHIVSDAWSLEILLRELASIYPAYRMSRSSPLPALELQYADFSHWQRQWLNGERVDRQLEYWRAKLKDSPVHVQFPGDQVQLSSRDSEAAGASLEWSRALSERLKELGRQEGASLFMVLLAAFKALLYRYTRQVDLVVGSPIANRHFKELEPLVGCFINTLVLRTSLSGDPTFRELVARVRETSLGAYANQDLPFEKLVEELGPERRWGRTPFFEILFRLHNASGPALELPDLRLTALPVENGATKFDLSMHLEDDVTGLRGFLQYNSVVFGRSTIEQILKHYGNLLEGAVQNPARHISALPILSEPERSRILEEWNQPAYFKRTGTCLHELFEQQVAKTPEAICAEFSGQELTYRELNRRGNRLARYLKRLGAGPEVKVGVYMERSIEMITAVLGVLKAGAAYVPLDPSYPSDRLVYMLDNAEVSILIVHSRAAVAYRSEEELIRQAAEKLEAVVFLDELSEQLNAESSDDPGKSAMNHNLAYVIYTSGSTGNPKGVMVSHGAIVNHLLWRQKVYPLGCSDRFLHKASLSFDIAVWEIFAPLIAGATLIVAIAQGQWDTAYLADVIARKNVTAVHFNPLTLPAFLEEPAIAKCLHLKHVFCGGEAMPATLPNRLHEVLTAELHNQYGPTETTVDALHWDCPRGGNDKAIPIGRPIANTQVYVLDESGEPVPVGVAGELYLGGDGLARGYINRPDLTAEKFVPNPFSKAGGERLYRTGDLVRWREDGNLEFLARMDGQVKLRGYRIELGEIESALYGHAGVRRAVLLVREDHPGDKKLVAYVERESGDQVTAAALKQTLKKKLPDYMVPSFFVFLDSFPQTVNGKVNRGALPAPEMLRAERQSLHEGPRNSFETRLVGIWENLFHDNPIGIHANFFEMGGHSLLALRLRGEVRNTFGVEFPLAALFEHPTIENLAEVIRLRSGATSRDAHFDRLVPIQPLGSRRPFFCIHPIGGNVFCYAEISRLLGTDQPFYGLQAEERSCGDSLPQMAASYLQRIRSVQATGPYLLGGWSMGGVIAFEIAQQLRSQGEQVPVLILIDSFPSFPAQQIRSKDEKQLFESFVDHLAAIAGEARVVDGNAKGTGRFGNIDPLQSEQLWQIYRSNFHALVQYQPQRYEGKLNLFAATDHPLLQPTPLELWTPLADGGLTVDLFPGDHYALLVQPAVRAVACTLAGLLN